MGTGGDDYLYEFKLWSHDRVHKQALDEEWTSEDGDVKVVLVKFSDAHEWNTIAAKSITCSPFFSQQLISDYSYSRGGGAELFPITVTAAVAARNYFPIPVTAAVAVRKDRK